MSSRRAASVREQLMKLGVDGNRLDIKGWGPVKPIATNARSTGRAKNRRVEFSVVDPDEIPTDGKAATEAPGCVAGCRKFSTPTRR